MSLSVLNCVIVFFSLWWVTLFVVLPIGVKRSVHAEIGMESGAPDMPRIGKKMLITTGLAVIELMIYICVIKIIYK